MITDEEYLSAGIDNISDEQQKKTLLEWVLNIHHHHKKVAEFIHGIKVGKSAFFAFLDAEKLNE